MLNLQNLLQAKTNVLLFGVKQQQMNERCHTGGLDVSW